MRNQYAAPYREIADIPSMQIGTQTKRSIGTGGVNEIPIEKSGKEILDALKKARFDSKQQWNYFNRSGDPKAYEAAQALDNQASNLEKTLESMAESTGNDSLVNSLREARKNIAKTYTIERAMQGTNVNAKELAKALDKGAMLEGDLLTSARFAQQYPDIARVPASGDANPMTALDWYGVGTTGGVSALAGGNPLFGFALPASRIVAREALLSKPVQRMMANKKYGIGPTKRLAEALASSPYATIGFTGGALPAFTE